jgi:hypothetical protein
MKIKRADQILLEVYGTTLRTIFNNRQMIGKADNINVREPVIQWS